VRSCDNMQRSRIRHMFTAPLHDGSEAAVNAIARILGEIPGGGGAGRARDMLLRAVPRFLCANCGMLPSTIACTCSQARWCWCVVSLSPFFLFVVCSSVIGVCVCMCARSDECRNANWPAHTAVFAHVPAHLPMIDYAKPMCLECGGPAELRCALCRVAHYCGASCQRRHWRTIHVNECPAAAAGAGGDVAAVAAELPALVAAEGV
jgi:MYND finger